MSGPQFNTKLGTRHRYVWLVPVLWMVGVVVGFKHPGDEYGLWVLSALPGVWIAWFVGNVGNLGGFLPKVLLAGGFVLGLGGLLMDRLRVPLAAWSLGVGLGTVALTLQMLLRYPSWEKAMAKNGSLTAYVCFGWNNSIALATALGVLITAALRWWWRRSLPPDPPPGDPTSDENLLGERPD